MNNEPLCTQDKVSALASLLEDKKAEEITGLNISKLEMPFDYFLIASGNSPAHLKALSDYVMKWVKKNKGRLISSEGTGQSGWMLIDTGDVVIHLFDNEHRRLYNLETLWGDATITHFTQAVEAEY